MKRHKAILVFLVPFLALVFCACQGNTWSQAQQSVQPVPVWTQAPLFAHVQRGDLRALKEALEAGADPNAVGPEGYSLVMQAVLSKNKDILKYLLNAGAKVNATGSEGVVAAATRSNDLELVGLLVEAGAPVNREVESRVVESPLVVATKYDNIGMVKYLLDRGANPNDSSCLGTTALHMASAKKKQGDDSVASPKRCRHESKRQLRKDAAHVRVQGG